MAFDKLSDQLFTGSLRMKMYTFFIDILFLEDVLNIVLNYCITALKVRRLLHFE